jgi:adenylyl-sulfate kinase
MSGDVQQPFGPGLCIWLTGLSGAGKTTIAKALEAELASRGRRVYLLDGDEARKVLSRDLGFGPEDRLENLRRIGEAAQRMVREGTVVIVACISPFEAGRQAARARFERAQFIEVFVDTPLSVCEARDVKGLYQKARAGLIPEFTGISSPYETPTAPELVVTSDGTRTPHEIACHVASLVFHA